jgi:hypothetical protein
MSIWQQRMTGVKGNQAAGRLTPGAADWIYAVKPCRFRVDVCLISFSSTGKDKVSNRRIWFDSGGAGTSLYIKKQSPGIMGFAPIVELYPTRGIMCLGRAGGEDWLVESRSGTTE